MSDDDKPDARGAATPAAPAKLLPSDDRAPAAPAKLLPSDRQAPTGMALRAGLPAASPPSPVSPPSPASPSPVEPTPTVPAAEASPAHPAGSASPYPSPAAAEAPLDRPEVQVGLAFAGGLLAAMILKRLGR